MRLRVAARAADADGGRHGARGEVDDRDRAVQLIGHERRPAVGGADDVVGELADLHQPDRPGGRGEVDDRQLVGLVQGHEQRGAVGRDRQSFGPTQAPALALGRAPGGRRQLDRGQLGALAGRRVDREDVDRVAAVRLGRPGRLAVALRLAADVGGLAVGAEGDAAVGARQRQCLDDPVAPDVDHLHVVVAVPRVDGPVEPAVPRQRPAGREVPDPRQRAGRAELAPAVGQPQGRTDLAVGLVPVVPTAAAPPAVGGPRQARGQHAETADGQYRRDRAPTPNLPPSHHGSDARPEMQSVQPTTLRPACERQAAQVARRGGAPGRMPGPVYAARVLTAFVLIHAEPDRIADLGPEIADVDGVAEVYSVTGDLDLVAIVRVRQHDELADVVTGRIAALDGIVHTTTMIAFRAYSRHDLDSMFGLGIE